MNIRYISGTPEAKNLIGFDASYSTEYIYRVCVQGMSVELHKEKLDAVMSRSYDIGDLEESIANSDHTFIADDDENMAGFAAVKFEEWNKRVIVGGIYVLPPYKDSGIGTALMNEAIGYAKDVGARCVWLETQNVNYPAISFYLRSGFRFCGFDDSLYDPETVPSDEIALYFCLDL